MKKIVIKVVSLVMALALCLGMGATALAAETTIEYPSPNDTGSIIVNGLDGNVTANAYQIAKAEYDDNGNMLGYVMTVEDTTFKINYDGSYDESALTEQNLAEVWNALGENPIATNSATTSPNGIATITDLPIGSYLVVITGSESVVYGMMIGSVYYSDSNGNWTIVSGEITDVKDCELWAKSTTPTVTKIEHHDGKSESHGETTNAGDEITFDIRIANIPSYLGDNPEFHVDDKLTGLTISEDELSSLTVRIMSSSSTSASTIATLVKDTDYTVTPVGDDAPYTEFDIDFVVDGKYTLNDYSGQGYVILIEYQAIVVDTGNYVDNVLEHDNDVVLTYATTSYLAGNNGTDDDHDYEYDFDAELVKEDASDSTPLSGAVFAIYTDYACDTPYTQNGEDVTATSDANGKFAFTGLDTGTYYFKEIEAPAGYAMNETVYAVTISATVSSTGQVSNVQIIYWIPTAESPSYSTEVTPIEPIIYNTPLGTLPNMGSTGITLCVIAGCAVIAAAVCGVVIYRRRSNA